MSMTREEALEKLLERYRSLYDLEIMGEEKLPLAATGDFHEYGNGYMLVREAKMWSANKHEYVYFYTTERLTRAGCEEFIAQAKALGEEKIVVEEGHMCSAIVAVVLCDEADDDAARFVKRYRYRKSFQFSLKGWEEVQAVAIDLRRNTIAHNPDAYRTAKYLKNVLYPKKRKFGSMYRLFNKLKL